jgi:hypothetical protein
MYHQFRRLYIWAYPFENSQMIFLEMNRIFGSSKPSKKHKIPMFFNLNKKLQVVKVKICELLKTRVFNTLFQNHY